MAGIKTSRALATVSSTPFSEKIVSTSLDTRHKFGPVRYIFRAKDGKVVLAEKEFDVFYVPAEGNKLVRKIQDGCVTVGALCTPGWRQQDSFGLGMNKWTEGWGGPHDQTWAFTQDLLEMGTRNVDSPERMLTSATRASHYTNPWRRFLNGMYSWDWFKEKLEKRLVSGDWSRQNVAKVHVFGSDRWNGIPVGSCFGWDVFVDFDKWLRANGEQGLKAKSRKEVVREISEEYGDKWQVFNLERYADKMLKTQDSIRKLGYDFTFETHGSFPMAGGELGRKLAKTHIGVGTDLFWELRRQDMWWSLGGRIAIVAANPDLRSGAYDEWGWINSEQNEFWFGANSEPGVARRQWYATYFLGRVTLDGEFLPYHETGFSSQGGHGIRYDANDHFWRTRVHNLITQIRPEKASGFGMVVSWQGQERRMGPKLGRQGFGLFPEDGEDDIESLCEKVYVPLVKQGLPISFVTSTHALKNWKGKNPLVLVDAVNWEDWEIEEVKRLQKNGATVISIGKQHPKLANIKAAEFFARERSADKKQGGIISWEGNLDQLNGITARHLCSRIMDALGNPLSTSRGLAVVPFVSNDHLFLAVNRQGDDSTPATVTVKPEFFHSKTKVSNVVSLDDGTILPTTQLDSGTVRVEFPLEDASGKVLMFGKAE
ncbi:MAG: hypothetical protein GX804_09230 [Lentisphaerae bacterium]|nr:hypothetical protein [Lentisphaerota bacterium]